MLTWTIHRADLHRPAHIAQIVKKKTIQIFGGKANLYKRVCSVLLCRFDAWPVGHAAGGNDPYRQIKCLRREWKPHKVLLCKFKLRSSSPLRLKDTVVPPLRWENVPCLEQVQLKDRETGVLKRPTRHFISLLYGFLPPWCFSICTKHKQKGIKSFYKLL